jgi:predicted ABC-type ATPase
MADRSPEVIVLAGPNGAGKTTASRSLLAERLQLMTFVNADVIAQGLAGFDPDSAALEASRIMLERLHALAARRENFAFETTLAARSYARWLRGLREQGYWVHLMYFWLQSADLAVARVAVRVQAGGHHIPENTIRQRYTRSLHNFFELYRPAVSHWEFYDNSAAGSPRLVAVGGDEVEDTILDETVWALVQKGRVHG